MEKWKVSGELIKTLKEIESCNKCCNVYPNYAKVLDSRKKACIEFRVFKNWVPNKVRTLFIAESPPWRRPGYFYNEGVEDSLREDRFNKKGRSIPKTIINTCSRSYLRREIDVLRPEKIFVLGKTALTGLQTIFRDSSLGKYKSMIESCGTELNVSGYNVIISLYPSDQNRRYYHEMKEAFEKLSRK